MYCKTIEKVASSRAPAWRQLMQCLGCQRRQEIFVLFAFLDYCNRSQRIVRLHQMILLKAQDRNHQPAWTVITRG